MATPHSSSPGRPSQSGRRRSLSPGARVHVHRTGSFTIDSVEPPGYGSEIKSDSWEANITDETVSSSARAFSNNNVLDLEISPSSSDSRTLTLDFPVRGPPITSPNWTSAKSVSSLYRAYAKLKAENQSLKQGSDLNGASSSFIHEHNCEYKLKVDDLLQREEQRSNMLLVSERKDNEKALRAEIVDLKAENDALCSNLQRLTVERENLEVRLEAALNQSNHEKDMSTHETYRKTIHGLESLLAEANDRNTELLEELAQQRTQFRGIQEQLEESYELSASLKRSILEVHATRKRELTRRLIAKLYTDYLRRGFQVWFSQTTNAAKFEMYNSALNERKQRRDRVVRRWTAQFQRQSLQGVFRAWANTTQRRLRNQFVVEKFLQRHRKQQIVSSWNDWISFVKKRKFARGTIRRLYERIVLDKLRRGFDSIRDRGYENVNLETKKRLATTLDSLQSVTETVDQLESMLAVERATKDHLKSILQKAQCSAIARVVETRNRKLMRKYFSRIQIDLKYEQSQQELLAKVVAKFRNKLKSAAMTTWRVHVVEVKHERQLLKQTIARFSRQRLFRMFSRWALFVQETQALRSKINKVVKRWNMRHLSTVFNSWVSRVDELKFVRTKVRKTLERIRNFKLVAALNKWRDIIIEQKKIDQVEEAKIARLLAYTSRMKNIKLCSSFNSWRENSQAQRRDRNVLQKFSIRISNRSLNRAWNAWNDWVSERLRVKQKAKLAIQKLYTRRVRHGFSRWQLACATSIGNDATKQAIQALQSIVTQLQENLAEEQRRSTQLEQELNTHREAAQEAEVLRGIELESVIEQRNDLRSKQAQRVIQSWRNHTLLVAFNAFRHATTEKKQKRRIIEQFLNRMRNTKLNRLFLEWKSNAKSLARDRVLLGNFVKRIKGARVATVFNTWKIHVSELKRHRVITTRCLKQWQNRRLRGIWDNWCDYTETSIAHKAQLRQAVNWLHRGTMVRTFKSWRYFVELAHQEREHDEMESIRLQQVVARFKQRSLAKSFDTWHENAKELISQRAIVKRFVSRWQFISIGRYFNGWCQYRENMMQRRWVLHSICRKQARAAMAHRFNCWRVQYSIAQRAGIAQLMKDLSVLKASNQELLLHRSELVAKVESLQVELKAKVEKEMELQTEMEVMSDEKLKLKQAQATREIKAWQQQSISTVFRALRQYTAEQKRTRSIVNQYVTRMRRTRLSHAFHGWVENVHSIVHKRNILESFVRRMRSTKTLCVFHTWRTTVLEWKKNRMIVKQFVNQWKNRNLKRLWNCWVVFTEESVSDKLRMRKALSWLNRGTLARTFQAWCTYVDVVHEEAIVDHQREARMQHIILRISKNTLSKCFETWREFVTDSVHYRIVVGRFVIKWRQASKQTFFNTWLTNVSSQISSRKLLTRLVHRAYHDRLSCAFNRLVRNSQEQFFHENQQRNKRELEELRELVSHGANRDNVVEVLQTKNSQLEEKSKNLQVRLEEESKLRKESGIRQLSRTVHERNRLSLKIAFSGLRASSERAKLVERMGTEIRHRRDQKLCVQAFRVWHASVLLNKHQRHVLAIHTKQRERRLLQRVWNAWSMVMREAVHHSMILQQPFGLGTDSVVAVERRISETQSPQSPTHKSRRSTTGSLTPQHHRSSLHRVSYSVHHHLPTKSFSTSRNQFVGAHQRFRDGSESDYESFNSTRAFEPAKLFSVMELMLRFAARQRATKLANAWCKWRLMTQETQSMDMVVKQKSVQFEQVSQLHQIFMDLATATSTCTTIRDLIVRVNGCHLGGLLDSFNHVSFYLFVADVDAGQLWTLLQGDDGLAVARNREETEESSKSGVIFRIPFGEGITGRVVTLGQSVHIGDARRDPRFVASVDQCSVKHRKSYYESNATAPSLRSSGKHSPRKTMNLSTNSGFSSPRSGGSSWGMSDAMQGALQQQPTLSLVAVPVLSDDNVVVGVLQACAEVGSQEEEERFLSHGGSVVSVASVMVGGLIKWIQNVAELNEEARVLHENSQPKELSDANDKLVLLEDEMKKLQVQLEAEISSRCQFEERAAAAELKLEALGGTVRRARVLESELERASEAVAEYDRWELMRSRQTAVALSSSVGPEFAGLNWNSSDNGSPASLSESLSRSRLEEPLRSTWAGVPVPVSVASEQEKLRREIREMKMRAAVAASRSS